MEQEFTSYHEAGHCVVAMLMGGYIQNASIAGTENGDRYGEVEIHWPNEVNDHSKILAILAGPVSEMIYRQEPLHPALVSEWQDDWKQAWELTPSTHHSELAKTRYLEDLVKKLHRRLSRDDCWAAIAAVSDLLLAHETIEHDEIESEVEAWISDF